MSHKTVSHNTVTVRSKTFVPSIKVKPSKINRVDVVLECYKVTSLTSEKTEVRKGDKNKRGWKNNIPTNWKILPESGWNKKAL